MRLCKSYKSANSWCSRDAASFISGPYPTSKGEMPISTSRPSASHPQARIKYIDKISQGRQACPQTRTNFLLEIFTACHPSQLSNDSILEGGNHIWVINLMKSYWTVSNELATTFLHLRTQIHMKKSCHLKTRKRKLRGSFLEITSVWE